MAPVYGDVGIGASDGYEPLVIDKGEGVYVYDKLGNRYIVW